VKQRFVEKLLLNAQCMVSVLKLYKCIVSEWLLFNANSANVQLYHRENKWIFNEMRMKSALFYINTLNWIFIVLGSLKQQSANRHVALGNIILIQNQRVFLLNAAYLAEKQQISILNSLVWSDEDSNPRSTAIEASTLIITPPMRLYTCIMWCVNVYLFSSLTLLMFF
jgi:hypothetical protein